MNIKQEIMEEYNSHFGEYGKDDFGSCSVECETNWKNIDNFLSSALERVEKKGYLEGLNKGARDMAKMCGKDQSCSMCLERLGNIKRLSPSEEKECISGQHIRLDGKEPKCHCQPKKEKKK